MTDVILLLIYIIALSSVLGMAAFISDEIVSRLIEKQ